MPGQRRLRDRLRRRHRLAEPQQPSLWDEFLASGDIPIDRAAEHRVLAAAHDGDVDAMKELARRLHAAGLVDEAGQWSRRAAHAEPLITATNRAHEAQLRGDRGEARFWWRQAAEHGDRHARYCLASLLEQDDELAEAERWYREAAQLDLPSAQTQLACLLQQRGATPEATYWWFRAAVLHRHPGAMFNLGCLADSFADARDARSWWTEAASLGHVDAMINLARMLGHEGDGELANFWWNSAIAAGHPAAQARATIVGPQQQRVATQSLLDRKLRARAWRYEQMIWFGTRYEHTVRPELVDGNPPTTPIPVLDPSIGTPSARAGAPPTDPRALSDTGPPTTPLPAFPRWAL